MESLFATQLLSSLSEAALSAKEGARSADALKQLLCIMVKSALEAKSEMADAHKQSVDMVVQSTNNQLDLVSSAIQSVFASTMSLGQEIVRKSYNLP